MNKVFWFLAFFTAMLAVHLVVSEEFLNMITQ